MNLGTLAFCLVLPSVAPPGILLGPDGERLPSPIVARWKTGLLAHREGFRLELSPSRRLALVTDYNSGGSQLQVWDTRTQTMLLHQKESRLIEARISDDDRQFSVGPTGEKRFFDLRTGKPLDLPPTTPGPTVPKRDWIVQQPASGTVQVRRLDAATILYEAKIRNPINPNVSLGEARSFLSTDGRWLLTASSFSPVVTLHCVRTRRPMGLLGEPSRLRRIDNADVQMVLAPDARTVVLTTFLRNGFLDLLSQVDLVEVASGKVRSRVTLRNDRPPQMHWLADGRTLVGMSRLSEMTLWDFTPRVAATTPQTLPTHWNDLASSDAVRAFRAIHAMALAPGLSGPYVERQLAATRVEPRVAQWIDELGADTFTERQQAIERLVASGESARQALETAYNHDDLEIRTRARTVLQSVDQAQPQTLRTLRAIELLEMLRRPTALRRLAAGLAGSRITEHAQAALTRLKAKPARPE
jgi:hypothetical protein